MGLQHPGLQPSHRSGTKRVLLYTLFGILFIVISYLSIHLISQASNDARAIDFRIFHWSVYIHLLVALILFFLVDALRFHHILKTVGVSLPFFDSLKLHFIYLFASAITPFTTGGGFAQLYFLSKRNVRLADSTAAITIRTIVSIFMFISLVPVALLINHDLFRLFPTGSNVFVSVFIGLVILAFLTMAYSLLHNPKQLKRIAFWILFNLKKKRVLRHEQYRHFLKLAFWNIDRFSQNLSIVRRASFKRLLSIFIYTFLYIVLLCSFSVILIKGVRPNLNLIKLLTLQFVATFITYFAPTPGATGAAEGIFFFAFSEFTPSGYMATIVLIWRFFSIYIGSILGLFVTGIEYWKVRRQTPPYNNGNTTIAESSTHENGN